MTLHAACVALPDPADAAAWAGVLLFGPPGSGKSDLALRLIDSGALLVADDRVSLDVRDGAAHAAAPEAIAGLIEVRGMGVVRVEALATAPVRLAVAHAPAADQPRWPEPAERELGGAACPQVAVDFGAPSAPARIRMALRATRLGLFADAKARLDVESR
jgi:hypothetical protein